ncbi:MAG: hypothetical protein AAGJ10_13625 [Bacteroidota bacterium]
MENLPDRLLTVIRSEIPDDETILWAGQPSEWEASKGGWPIFLFSIPWTLFAVFWMFAAAGFGMPNFADGTGFFALFGIPFVLVGLFMLASPFLLSRSARNTVYVVTDQRALIFTGKDTVSVKTYTPDEFDSLDRTIKADGTGSVLFKDPPKKTSKNNTVDVKLGSHGFFGIPDAQYVYDTLRGLQDTAVADTEDETAVDDGADMMDDYHGTSERQRRRTRT